MSYDGSRVEEIGAELDLRQPNFEALDAVAHRLESADGEPFEAVLDMATAVGKTYIAAGLVDYVTGLGVRNIVIITPSRAILTKTVNNFSIGHAKAIPGLACSPLVITVDDFQRGRVGSALDDADTVKLFVFTVQQLIKPGTEMKRRVRDFRETLGQGLYDYLKSVKDLIVIADEHHAYYGPVFSDAVRDLDALALIGLTATPNPKTPPDQIVFRYTLGQAIADRLVKTPVLVGRKDDRHDIETQLADGVALLNAKRAAVQAWCESTGVQPINPVMFIVCQNIDDADAVAETLSRPQFFGDRYDDAVLTIHSEAADDALTRLDRVEDLDSKVRAIVSVSMLKEGWDVKNIYVICALRALASQVLTEQTLGRGLRLPFGRLTDVEMLDTVEVLGHDRYEDLLRRSSILVKGLVDDRSKLPADPMTGISAPLEASELPRMDGGNEVGRDPTPIPSWTPAIGGAPMGVADADERKANLAAQVATISQLVVSRKDAPPFYIPKMSQSFSPKSFSLSSIKDGDFRSIGEGLAATPEDVLRRSKLEIIETPTGLQAHPVPAVDVVASAAPQFDLGQGKQTLVDAILDLGLVTQTMSEKNAARRLASALIDGLGPDAEKRLGSFFNTVLDTVVKVLRSRYKSIPAVGLPAITEEVFSPVRAVHRIINANRYDPFSRDQAYEGWSKSLLPIEWFDSSTERDMAFLLDEASEVSRWVRLHRSDLVIPWEGSSYNPDFAVEATDGVYWLIEVKADKDLGTVEVLAKKAAAEQWARFASDSADVHHLWRYLLVGETQLANAHGNWSVLLAQAGAK